MGDPFVADSAEPGKNVLSRIGGNAALLRQLIPIFSSQAPELISAAREALERRDRSAFTRSIHKLKGSISHFKSSAGETLAQQLETAAKVPVPDWIALSPTLDLLEDAVGELLAELSRVQAGLE